MEYIAKQLCDSLGINLTGSSRTLKRIGKNYGIYGVRKRITVNGRTRIYRVYTEDEYKKVIRYETLRRGVIKKAVPKESTDRNLTSSITPGQLKNRSIGLYHRLTPYGGII